MNSLRHSKLFYVVVKRGKCCPYHDKKYISHTYRMSSQSRTNRDGATASFAEENPNQMEVQEQEVHLREPRVRRNTNQGRRNTTRRGRARGRTSNRISRAQRPTSIGAPTKNLSDEIA